MNINHPFKWMDEAAQPRAFLILFIITIAVMIGLSILGAPLKTDMAPAGIISFEFAGNLSAAEKMMQSWGETGRVYAGLNIGLDYLYLFVYSSSICLGCIIVARRFSDRLEIATSLGIFISWGQIPAAMCDAIENYGLIRVLLGSSNEIWPVIAWWAAILKFLLVTAGIAYVLVGFVVTALTKPRLT